MSIENSGYLTIKGSHELFISDDPDLTKAKNIYHFYLNKKINSFVLEGTENGMNGGWIVFSENAVNDRLEMALIDASISSKRNGVMIT
jgi:hypothetical protein